MWNSIKLMQARLFIHFSNLLKSNLEIGIDVSLFATRTSFFQSCVLRQEGEIKNLFSKEKFKLNLTGNYQWTIKVAFINTSSLRYHLVLEKNRAGKTFPTVLLLTRRLGDGRAALCVTFLERQRRRWLFWTFSHSQINASPDSPGVTLKVEVRRASVEC